MEREGDRPIQVVRARYTRAAPIPAAPGGEWRVEGRGKGRGKGEGEARGESIIHRSHCHGNVHLNDARYHVMHVIESWQVILNPVHVCGGQSVCDNIIDVVKPAL